MKFFAFAALILAVFQAGVWAATAPEEPPTCGVSLWSVGCVGYM